MSVLIGTSLDDTLAGAADSDNTIFGDPPPSEFTPLPGNDHLTGGSNSTNLLSGDLEFLQGGGPDIAAGGNDVLIGGESSTNRLFGDASESFFIARGGDDVLTGGNDSVNTMSGDAGGNLESQFFRGLIPSLGGNDTLVGGARSANTMFGDAAGALVASFGGDDTLVAGDGGTNTLIGDALILDGDQNVGGSTGGDDLLVSGTGTDDMWGDGKQLLNGSTGGADVFRFLTDNGNDFIHDFERGKDLIDVTAISTAAAARSAGSLSASGALGRAYLGGPVIEEIDADGDGTTDFVIHLGGENSVTVLGVTGLSDPEFLTPSSYVLFSRTSTGEGHRDEWVGSEANSHPSTTPESIVPASTFNADLATGPGTALDGPGAADYAADGILQNANLAIFNLTEAPSGTFATDAPAGLAARIVAGTPFFGTANTDLDPAQSDIDLAAGKLHLAQTEADRNGIKNLEISLDSATSLRDIRLENFVDTRLKLGGFSPHSNQPPGERFEVQLLGAKRGEVDASEAPQAMDLLLAPQTHDDVFQKSFVIKGSIFDDTVTIEAGALSGSVLGQGAGRAHNTIVGENSISAGETGGNDTLTGGGNSSNRIFGDALSDLVAATGGNDTVTGGANSINVMSGDAQFSLRARVDPFLVTDGGSSGGNDILTGGANSTNTMYGDAGGDLVANRFLHGARGGNDVLTGGANSTNVMYGDAGGRAVGGPGGRDSGRAFGGMDKLTGGDNSINTMVGDFRARSGASGGGSDVLIGGANSTNTIIGDLEGDDDAVQSGFGSDTLIGGANSTNVLSGDLGEGVFGFSGGGSDTITGGDNSTNTMFGEARGSGSFGGSDVLTGGANSTNVMFGDAGGSVHGGGNDTLIAGVGGSNILVGDAREGVVQGGDDLLVSGTGTDDMWGDSQSEFSIGGHDVFRFAADNGNDLIHDFEQGIDIIDLTGVLAIAANAGTIVPPGLSATLVPLALTTLTVDKIDANRDGRTDSVIRFDAANSVTVLSFTGLKPTDFNPSDVAIDDGGAYVLFGRSSPPQGTRDKWVGSEANSQPSGTPGSSAASSSFNADNVIAAGTVLAGSGAADYAADGILSNPNVAMFDLTESPAGVFATGAPAGLDARIAAHDPLFGAATTDLDPTHSEINVAAGKLHLAQTDQNWNGIKNLEINLKSATSFRDIRMENFVDARLKVGDGAPDPNHPLGEVFDMEVLGSKRGEVDGSRAPQAIDLLLEVWTNSGIFQNSFDIKGSVFDDVVSIKPGEVINSQFGQSENWYQKSENPGGIRYTGQFTTVSANLGAGNDQFNSFTEFRTFEGFLITENGQFRTIDHVWGGTGDDTITTGYGNDMLFGDTGSGARLNRDPILIGGQPGNDNLSAGAGSDWIEGNGGEDVIDCGTENLGRPFFLDIPDGSRDVVNINAGDGVDVVNNFGAGFAVVGPAGPGSPPSQVELVHDVLRIENVGTLTTEVRDGDTVVANGAGAVFLVGVTVPLTHSIDGKYLLLFDAS